MTNLTTRTESVLHHERTTAIRSLERITQQIRLLSSPDLALLVNRNPDCWLNASSFSADITLDSWIENDPREGVDISDCDGVEADASGYALRQDTKYTVAGLAVRRTITVVQPYTPEEKALLRDLGKLQSQPSHYDALVCGV